MTAAAPSLPDHVPRHSGLGSFLAPRLALGWTQGVRAGTSQAQPLGGGPLPIAPKTWRLGKGLRQRYVPAISAVRPEEAAPQRPGWPERRRSIITYLHQLTRSAPPTHSN